MRIRKRLWIRFGAVGPAGFRSGGWPVRSAGVSGVSWPESSSDSRIRIVCVCVCVCVCVWGGGGGGECSRASSRLLSIFGSARHAPTRRHAATLGGVSGEPRFRRQPIEQSHHLARPPQAQAGLTEAGSPDRRSASGPSRPQKNRPVNKQNSSTCRNLTRNITSTEPRVKGAEPAAGSVPAARSNPRNAFLGQGVNPESCRCAGVLRPIRFNRTVGIPNTQDFPQDFFRGTNRNAAAVRCNSRSLFAVPVIRATAGWS